MKDQIKPQYINFFSFNGLSNRTLYFPIFIAFFLTTKRLKISKIIFTIILLMYFIVKIYYRLLGTS